MYQYIQFFTPIPVFIPNTGNYPKHFTQVGIPLPDPRTFSVYALNLFIHSHRYVYVHPTDGLLRLRGGLLCARRNLS